MSSKKSNYVTKQSILFKGGKIMMKRWTLQGCFVRFSPLIVLLMLYFSAPAGTTGKIAGTVKDTSIDEPLIGANIVIEGMLMGAATDADGDYFIINVPPGTYSLTASMLGYATETKVEVRVNVDRTSRVNFNMKVAAIEGEEVTVVAEKPIIRKDLTASITEFSGQEISLSPAENLQDQIRQQRGILLGVAEQGKSGYRFTTTPGDELHLRGGRENETLFMIDGMSVTDPLWGGSNYVQNTSASSITEMSTLAGTFNAEYGNAMSGIINVIAREGSGAYHGNFSFYTDQFGVEDWDYGTSQSELTLSGPLIPGNEKLTFFLNGQNRATDGYLNGYTYPNWVDSRGEDVNPVTGIPNGSSKEVSLDKQEFWNGMAKINWRVSPRIKLSAFAAYIDLKQAYYEHWLKYNPEGSPFDHSKDLMLNLNGVFTLSPSTFIDLGFSRQEKTRFLGVYDSWDDYMIILEESDPTGNWSVSGEDWTWQHDESETYDGRFSITSQINKIHLIKTGVSYRKLSLNTDSRNPNERGIFYTNYERNPYEFAAYIQDKMEFSQIGMILNAGLRFEMWNANSPYWVDITRLADMELEDATTKKEISPRLGVSYPIMETAAFHFAYGHFYQFPKYTLLYQGQRELTDPEDKYWDDPNFQDRKGKLYFPMLEMYDFRLANADMEPEKTVSYEAGVQTKITTDIAVDITAFYREMSNLVGERWVVEAAAGAGLKYSDNYDYGNAKGVEVVLNKRYSNYFSLRANYTFSKSLVTSSTPWAQIQIENPTFQTYNANWDRPHNFSFDLFIGKPANWALSFFGNFQSGLPYSIRVEPNTERMPYIGTVDMRLSKSFKFFGFKETIFLRVLNLFDRKNIYFVYDNSGKPDLPLGLERNERNLNVYDDPSYYGPPRQVRLGASIEY